jgi:electron transfer flavoprotein alpha subunit
VNLNNFLVYIETDDNGLVTANSFEALNAAKQAAKVKDAAVSALVIGDDVSKAVEEMRFHGIEKIFIKQGGDFKNYRPRNFLAVFEKIYQLLKPGLALFCNSKNSLDLAARAAVYLDAALITDCVEIKWEDEELFFTKPIYSNNVMAVYSTGDFPCIATLRSKSFSPSERLENQKGEIIDAGPINAPALDEYEVIEKCFIKDGEKKLADADIIVAGGRGIGGPEGFIELKKLADMLGGHIGASRPPCDLGWVAPSAQVGITGAIVSPSVYLAVGLSGSFQHMAGMSGSKTIIAVNLDPKANIFKISDFGVVGDYAPVLAGIMKEISDR